MERGKINQLWHLYDVLSVPDAAVLIAGFDPDEFTYEFNDYGGGHHVSCSRDRNIDRDDPAISEKIKQVEIVFGALRNAVKGRKLILVSPVNDECWKETLVAIDELRAWLESRGVNSGFFFPEKVSSAPDWLA